MRVARDPMKPPNGGNAALPKYPRLSASSAVIFNVALPADHIVQWGQANGPRIKEPRMARMGADESCAGSDETAERGPGSLPKYPRLSAPSAVLFNVALPADHIVRLGGRPMARALKNRG